MGWLTPRLVLLTAGTLLGCPANEPDPAGDDDDDSSSVGDDDDSSLGDDDDSAFPPLTTEEQQRGQARYGIYCASCHGLTLGGGGAVGAPSLSNETFLATATDAFLASSILHGRPGTAMSAWGSDGGGPLGSTDVAEIVAYLRAWQGTEPLDVHDQEVIGEPATVAALYAGNCAECHGAEGQGESALSLNNPRFLQSASDGFIRYAIEAGRPGTKMDDWGALYPAFLLDDLTALVRAWEGPVDESVLPPFEPDLDAPLLHDGGPDADFADALRDGLRLPLADLRDAYDAGEAFVLIDVRPGGDYYAGHVPGAVWLPFYRVDELASALPSDAWLITYSAGPHTLAEEAAAALSAQGAPQVGVLDEGWFAWLASGGDVVVGAERY